MEIEYLAELDEELPNELGDGLTYKSKSPYGRHFENILTTTQALINQLEIQHVGSSKLRDNVFFLPKLPIFLVTYYMPICPLWTGFILAMFLPEQRTICRCSNAIVENWMKVAKHNILTKEVKIRPADIRKIRIHGRVNAFDFAFNPIGANIQCRKRPS